MSLENLSKLTVGDILIRKVLTVTDNETVMDAAKKMAALNVGAIVIVNKDKQVVGIFSERDNLNKVTSCGKNPSETKITEVLTPKIVTFKSDATVFEALRIMHEMNFRHAPVVENKALIGIISIKDINKAIYNSLSKILFE
ncbi:MAG: CBS domain-containing protein [Candidatus Omnitrophica bacterium]|nr:CBS domain-containing protein [Candidatus Omnitrophota bacterium]